MRASGSRRIAVADRDLRPVPPVRRTPRLRWPTPRAGLGAVASGVFLFLGCPPWNLDWVVWAALVPGLYAAERAGGGFPAFVCGVLAGIPFFSGVSYGLLPHYPWLCVAMVPAFSALMGLVFAAQALLRASLLSPALGALVLPAGWVLVAEQLPAAVGLPWSLALTQTHHLFLLQIASLLGWSAISFLLLFVTGALVELAGSVTAPRRREAAVRTAVAAVLTVALCVLYGAWCLTHGNRGEPGLRVATVQPVIAPETYQYQGLNPAYRRAAKETVRRLSAEASATRPDLLLWPEGGNGQINFRIPLLRQEIEELAQRSGATLLVSSHDIDEEGRLFNAVFAVSPEGRVLGRYAKVELTPVAERTFTAGTSLAPLPTRHGPVGTLICWESAFPGLARRLVRQGAALLFASTSDASLRHSSLTFLHARAAILRAIENRRPLVQAANTGPSLIVNAYGEVTAKTPFGARTILVGTVTPAHRESVYTRVGDWPLLGIVLAVLVLALRTPATWSPTRVRGPDGAGWWTGLGLVACAVGVAVLLSAASVARIGAGLPAFHGSWREGLAAFIRPAEPVVPPDAATRFLQARDNTCGVAALAQMLSSLGMEVSEADLLPYVPLGPKGASMAALAGAARRLGLRAWGERQSFAALMASPLPVIAHVRDEHYVVVLAAEPEGGLQIFDPAAGYLRVAEGEFRGAWDGYVLMVRFDRLRDDG